MLFSRAAGILLHPTSLPGPGGIGSLGPESIRFIDLLHSAGISLWQVLPLGPTGFGDSPYSALSAFAGNPLLIALEPLVEEGLLTSGDVEPLRTLPETQVDFGTVVTKKIPILRRAFQKAQTSGEGRSSLEEFRLTHTAWLDDFSLYMAIKNHHGGAPWYQWEPQIRCRDQAALIEARQSLTDDIEFEIFMQQTFYRQWRAVRQAANRKGIRIVGDIPIFVAGDSADVWANQDLFQLDEEGKPTVVAGVPPDYFSATGQLWGNPHYRWDAMRQTGFKWWIERFRAILKTVDIVRLDHFRGFAASWAVPYGDETAVRGEWVPTPGRELFFALKGALGDLPIIAENLGVITPDVEALRREFGFPGMTILQFAFGSDPANGSLPHNMTHDTVVYTGTHDNDTTVGWFSSIPAAERSAVLAYIGTQGLDVSWDLMRLAFASVARLAVVPFQDVLRLGTAARMNLPGRAAGNWGWRYVSSQVSDEQVRGLRFLTDTYGRLPESGMLEQPACQ